MPVQTIFGAGYPNPASVIKPPKALFGRARVNAIKAEFAIDANVSLASYLLVGRVPTSAILMRASTMICTAITTGAIHLGLDRRGSISSANLYVPSAGAQAQALLSAQSIGTAGAFPALAAVSVANLDAEVWRLLGLTSDPGEMAAIYATVSTAATVAGTLAFEMLYQSED